MGSNKKMKFTMTRKSMLMLAVLAVALQIVCSIGEEEKLEKEIAKSLMMAKEKFNEKEKMPMEKEKFNEKEKVSNEKEKVSNEKEKVPNEKEKVSNEKEKFNE